MEKEIKKVKKQITIIILFSLSIFGSSVLLSNFLDNQWISIFIGFSGSIIGGVATMLAVYSTLMYDRSQRNLENRIIKEKKINDLKSKKIKLKIILKNEIEMLARYVEYNTLVEISRNIAPVLDNYGDIFFMIKGGEKYHIDKDFKSRVYELLMLSENDYEISNTKLLLEFYNKYLNALNLLEDEKNLEYAKAVFTGTLLSNQMLRLEIDSLSIDILGDSGEDKNKDNDFNINMFLEFIDEFNQEKIHYNDELLRVMDFLEEYYNSEESM